MTTPTTPFAPARRPTGVRQTRRRARVQLIRDGARVRRALGQDALHERVDGEHIVVYRGRRFRGPSIDAAIRVAREGGK